MKIAMKRMGARIAGILGAGFSGSRLAALASALQIPVISTRREPSPDSGHLAFDTATGQAPDRHQLEGITHLLNTIPPDRDGNDPVLKTLGDQIKQWPLRWVGYLSTTGVYGNTDGAWVYEDDPPEPTQDRSRRRLACEQEWQASGLPLQILRLPGIYGPGRSALAAVKAGTLQPVDKPGQMFCRIHVDDVAAAALKKAEEKSVRFLIPTDNIVTESEKIEGKWVFNNERVNSDVNIPDGVEGVDIGPDTAKTFSEECLAAKTVLWNGPMGIFEDERFAVGTFAVAKAVADATKNGATSIIGGGDSVKAINKSGLGEEVTFMSTGGGASLEFLEGKELPGVAALSDK